MLDNTQSKQNTSDFPETIYAETKGTNRIWRPFYEQADVPHKGIGEYRLISIGTTPVNRAAEAVEGKKNIFPFEIKNYNGHPHLFFDVGGDREPTTAEVVMWNYINSEPSNKSGSRALNIFDCAFDGKEKREHARQGPDTEVSEGSLYFFWPEEEKLVRAELCKEYTAPDVWGYLRFPAMLRKMWSAQEVQKWIDDRLREYLLAS